MRWSRRSVILALLVAASAAYPSAHQARAQDAAAGAGVGADAKPAGGQELPSTSPPPAHFPILVIRQSDLFSESTAARSISSQAAEAERALDAELDKVGETLRTREKELSDKRATTPKADFDTLAAEFERDVRAFYARSQRERGLVDQAEGRARAELKQVAQKVLIEIMRRHDAQIMLDEAQVVLSMSALDITQEAIDRLNQLIPEIKLDLAKPQPASQP